MKLQHTFRIQSQPKKNQIQNSKQIASLAWYIIYTMSLPLIYDFNISASINCS